MSRTRHYPERLRAHPRTKSITTIRARSDSLRDGEPYVGARVEWCRIGNATPRRPVPNLLLWRDVGTERAIESGRVVRGATEWKALHHQTLREAGGGGLCEVRPWRRVAGAPSGGWQNVPRERLES